MGLLPRRAALRCRTVLHGGGHYLDRGVLATNAQLVERAASLLANMGVTLQTPDEARQTLGLRKHTELARLRSAA